MRGPLDFKEVAEILQPRFGGHTLILAYVLEQTHKTPIDAYIYYRNPKTDKLTTLKYFEILNTLTPQQITNLTKGIQP
jgi:hypothetical protein